MIHFQKTINTPVTRQFAVSVPEGEGPFPLLVGFHGYGETGESHLEILRDISRGLNWICCAPDGLHDFYNKKGNPGCSWMTGRNRDERIEENICYINNVIRTLQKEFHCEDRVVYHGFSQGTSMAVRAALLSDYPAQNVMLLAGDIPDDTCKLEKISHVLIGRGCDDKWYTDEKYQKDKNQLEKHHVALTQCLFKGGHDCHDDYIQAARNFLRKHC